MDLKDCVARLEDLESIKQLKAPYCETYSKAHGEWLISHLKVMPPVMGAKYEPGG